jgi:tetratricopeptide (TPR) repeat protein
VSNVVATLMWVFVPLLWLGTVSPLCGQDVEQAVKDKVQKAIELMDKGQIDESIVLLDEAYQLDPTSYLIPYEKALAMYMKKDYKEAVRIFESLTSHKDADAQIYQMLGNSYSTAGEEAKALDAYAAGLKVFPDAGRLYLETGNVYLSKKDYENAVKNYERGIAVDPMYPSNYYRASKIFLMTSDEVWGMLYGEIFVNLEVDSKRTAEISELLFKTYQSEIKVSADKRSVSFCQNSVIPLLNLKDAEKPVLPFCLVYEPLLAVAVVSADTIELSTLNGIRTRFLDAYFDKKFNESHPNVLFDYQRKIEEAGHFEAYNRWLLSAGDEDAFTEWTTTNPLQWQLFVSWYQENPLLLSQERKFVRTQY